MPNPTRTYKKRSGVYYMRLLVPKALITYTKSQKIIYSLRTKDRRVAYLEALKVNLAFEHWISIMTDKKEDRFPALIVEHRGTKFEFDLDKPAESQAYQNLMAKIDSYNPDELLRKLDNEKLTFSLHNGFESWVKSTQKVYSKATQAGYYPKVKSFITYAKSINISICNGVNKQTAVDYRDFINIESISPLTVDKHINALKQFFDHLIKIERYNSTNPFANLNLIKKSQLEANTNNYLRFIPDEIQALFSLDVYQSRFKKPDLFYSPLISITMGLRLEEAAQLHVADVYQKNGIWLIDINDDGPDKQLKTPSSKRVLPIPSFLLETNFLDYCQFIKERFGVGAHLYPYLIKTKNGFGKNVGYNFTQHKKEIIKVNEEDKNFHSLRKTVGAMLDEKRISHKLRKSILGHVVDSDITDDIYGSKDVDAHSKIHLSLNHKLEALEQIQHNLCFKEFQFDFLNLNLDKLMVNKKRKQAKAEFVKNK